MKSTTLVVASADAAALTISFDGQGCDADGSATHSAKVLLQTTLDALSGLSPCTEHP